MSFYKTFNKLCKVHDNTIVFRDWLDYSIDQFLINPDLKYFQHDKYNENEYKLKIIYPDLHDDTVLFQIKFERPSKGLNKLRFREKED